jgi:hypothetical protein
VVRQPNLATEILLDRTDLPDDFKLGTENWYVIIDGIRYQVLGHEDYESFAYIVRLKSTHGCSPLRPGRAHRPRTGDSDTGSDH